MKSLSLLGSTGSIGTNVLDIVRRFPDTYRIVALAAGSNIELLAQQVEEFKPEIVSVGNSALVDKLAALLPGKNAPAIVAGEQGNCEVAACDAADYTVSSIVGGAGLLPTLAAIDAGKDIGLANKETLVMAGQLVMQRVAEKGVQMLPIDSEHSAIFQSLEAGNRKELKKLILTASGGPFRGYSQEQLQQVTRSQALNHPNWSMGPKITIDSSTLMNKGLEVIEARWLFDVEPSAIEVVVHPQSIVHSLVEFCDGSVIGQLGLPDMRVPIAYALAYPKRLPLQLESLSLAQCSRLDFHQPDYDCFPCLKLAFQALETGGVLPAVLNAANEVAVEAFLKDRINYLQISETVASTMDTVRDGRDDSLDDILAADRQARQVAARYIEKLS